MSDRDPYQLLTRAEVAEHLHCSVNHVTTLTQAGTLYSVRVGRRVLVPRCNLEAYIRGEPTPAPGDGNWPPTPSLFDDDTP